MKNKPMTATELLKNRSIYGAMMNMRAELERNMESRHNDGGNLIGMVPEGSSDVFKALGEVRHELTETYLYGMAVKRPDGIYGWFTTPEPARPASLPYTFDEIEDACDDLERSLNTPGAVGPYDRAELEEAYDTLLDAVREGLACGGQGLYHDPDVTRAMRRALAATRGSIPVAPGKEVPREVEEELAEVSVVKCRKCGQSDLWANYAHMSGAVPKFCRCKPGQEELFRTKVTRDVAKRIKSPGR